MLIDLDDTLLDYSGAAGRCWAEACAAIGGAAGLDVATLASAVDETRRWFWSDPARHARERVQMLGAWTKIAAAALTSLGHAPDDLAPAIARDFAARRRAAMALFHDAVPCLERLRTGGVRLGLVTNGDATMQREKIARFDLARYFDLLVIEGELGTGKPDPAVYRHALAALGTAPEETCMVGDNLEWDVAAPQRLGLTGIWLDRARSGVPAEHAVRPDRVIHALSDLVDLA